ncbi:MAG: hypothetical protein HYU64_14105 [Armatimonadetes bacterium]|nr:hypothetical protein [Armatimonadota bacterium]
METASFSAKERLRVLRNIFFVIILIAVAGITGAFILSKKGEKNAPAESPPQDEIHSQVPSSPNPSGMTHEVPGQGTFEGTVDELRENELVVHGKKSDLRFKRSRATKLAPEGAKLSVGAGVKVYYRTSSEGTSLQAEQIQVTQ